MRWGIAGKGLTWALDMPRTWRLLSSFSGQVTLAWVEVGSCENHGCRGEGRAFEVTCPGAMQGCAVWLAGQGGQLLPAERRAGLCSPCVQVVARAV